MTARRLHARVCYALMLLLPLLTTTTHALDTIGPEALKPGMRGYALSVFQGVTPERFDVELVDVVQGPWTAKKTLLVKAADANAVRKINAYGAGFSGSPVYFSGKIVGAVSYMEKFQQEHILGVTLIGDMLHELTLLDQSKTDEQPLPTFACDDCRLPPGSMITIPLVRGDIWMGASGTVTTTVGNNVLGFGHPNHFVGAHVPLPMHRAAVNGVLAKLDFSHKIVTPMEEVGAVIWDGAVAVVGRLGQKAPMFPCVIRYGTKTFDLEVIQHVDVLPKVVAEVLQQIIDSMAHIDPEGLDLLMAYRVDLTDGAQLRWRQRYAVAQAAGKTKNLLRVLLAGHTSINRIEIDLTEVPKGQLAQIIKAYFGPKESKKAQAAPLYVDLALKSGQIVQRTFHIPIPKDYTASRFPIKVMVGDAIRPQAQEPQTPQQVTAWLNRILRSDDLVVLYPGGRTSVFYAQAGITRQVQRVPWRLSGSANAEIKVRYEK